MELAELIELFIEKCPFELDKKLLSQLDEIKEIDVEYAMEEFIDDGYLDDTARERETSTYEIEKETLFISKILDGYDWSDEYIKLLEDILEAFNAITDEARDRLDHDEEQEMFAYQEKWEKFYKQDWIIKVYGEIFLLRGDRGDPYHRVLDLSDQFMSSDVDTLNDNDIKETYKIRVKDHYYDEGLGRLTGHDAPDFEIAIDQDMGVDYAQKQLDDLLEEVGEKLTEIVAEFI